MVISKKERNIVLIVVAVVLIAFTFLDLPLSKAIFNIDSVFGNIFAAFGELPGILIAAISGVIILLTIKGKNILVKIISVICGAFLFLSSSAFAGFLPVMYLKANTVVFPIMAIAVAIITCVLAVVLVRHNAEKSREVALVGATLFFSSMVVVNVVKIFWGRMRFRIMEAPYDGFTKWIFPQGMVSDDQYKSFPSGHTAGATVIIAIMLLPMIYDGLKDKQIILKVVAYAWAFLVALSRIILGAHFATDVTVGFLITWLLFLLLQKLFIKTENKVPNRK